MIYICVYVYIQHFIFQRNVSLCKYGLGMGSIGEAIAKTKLQAV